MLHLIKVEHVLVIKELGGDRTISFFSPPTHKVQGAVNTASNRPQDLKGPKEH